MADFVLIDNTELRFVAGAETVHQLEYHAELLCKGDFTILPTRERKHWSIYDIAELARIHKNTCGKAVPPGDYSGTLQAVVNLMASQPEDPATVDELAKKLGRVLPPPNQYRAQPTGQASKRFVPTDPATLPDAPTRAPRAKGGTPRGDTPAGAVARPKGGVTGRVWAIADTEAAKVSPTEDPKNVRKAIVAACVAEGIDPSTAATQYSKWRRHAKG